MLDTMGIIFAQDEGYRMGALTQIRSLAALPVAGRYRIIDFILSNMVNSGIRNVGITTKYNYRSLMDHIGDGSAYDLNRKKYGLFILPPFYKQEEKVTDSAIETLHRIMHYIRRSNQRYVLLADSKVICNMTFDKMMECHLSSKADITMAYRDMDENEAHSEREVYLDVNENGKITAIEPGTVYSKMKKRALGFYLVDSNFLESVVESAMARGDKDLVMDIFAKAVDKLNIVGYKYDGYAKTVDDIPSYYDFNMQLLDTDVRNQLFASENKIYTKVKDKVPARYLKNANVKCSIVADGCKVDGTVENSILFRGVEVRKGCEIRNSIIMQDGLILENSKLNYVIMDKQVCIERDRNLSGAESFPFVIGKNRRI